MWTGLEPPFERARIGFRTENRPTVTETGIVEFLVSTEHLSEIIMNRQGRTRRFAIRSIVSESADTRAFVQPGGLVAEAYRCRIYFVGVGQARGGYFGASMLYLGLPGLAGDGVLCVMR